MTTTVNGRTFQLIKIQTNHPLTDADLIARGFDGTMWHGTSAPVGRQRITKTGLFYRTQHGTYEPVLIL